MKVNQLIDLNPKIASCHIRVPLPFDLLVARSPYSRKPSREKNFHEFHGFVAIRESFLREIGGVVFFDTARASNPQKFLRKNRKSFLPRKFPAIRYVNCISLSPGYQYGSPSRKTTCPSSSNTGGGGGSNNGGGGGSNNGEKSLEITVVSPLM